MPGPELHAAGAAVFRSVGVRVAWPSPGAYFTMTRARMPSSAWYRHTYS